MRRDDSGAASRMTVEMKAERVRESEMKTEEEIGRQNTKRNENYSWC